MENTKIKIEEVKEELVQKMVDYMSNHMFKYGAWCDYELSGQTEAELSEFCWSGRKTKLYEEQNPDADICEELEVFGYTWYDLYHDALDLFIDKCIYELRIPVGNISNIYDANVYFGIYKEKIVECVYEETSFFEEVYTEEELYDMIEEI